MNLTISPVNVNSRSSNLNNTKNNQAQNFGALKASFVDRSEHYIPRIADTTLDGLIFFFEKQAAKIGLNTEKLENKGYKLNVDSHDLEALDMGYLHGTLVDKEGKAVVKNGKKLDITFTDLNSDEKAVDFAKSIKDAGIIA